MPDPASSTNSSPSHQARILLASNIAGLGGSAARHQVAIPKACSSSANESSRCISSRCRCGTLRRHPTRPKSSLSALFVKVMFRACPSNAIDSG